MNRKPGRSHQPRRRFGQNFLHDQHVIERLVAEISPRPGQGLVEIGPGQGALTQPLLAAAGALDVIEIDRDLCEHLAQRHGAAAGFRLHPGDALSFDFTHLATTAPSGTLRVVGNLPYNISTPLLFHLLRHRHVIKDMHLMLQQEVVTRLTAQPGSKAFGRLSAMVQLDCIAQSLFSVGPGAFTPAPKVTSAVVRLTVRNSPMAVVNDRSEFEHLVRLLFSHRRKTLRATLKGRLEAGAIANLGIDPTARPESLSVMQLSAMANAISAAR